MKYYYDFDMAKTFTEEELKQAYEEIKNDISYCDFDDFIQCEKMYMDEISEEIYNALKGKEILNERLEALEKEANERLNEIPEQFNDLEDGENWNYWQGALAVIENIKDLLKVE